MINPFINRTENRLSKTELIKTIFMTVTGIAIARMILVIVLVFLMLFTLFLTSIGYYSNEKNLGKCAECLFTINQFGSDIVKRFKSICCRNQSPNTSNFHEMSRTRRCLLFMVQIYARCILYLLGYYYINEKFPTHKNWLVFPSYMERSESTKICLANHVSFVDTFYFLSRCIPRSVVIQANVVKPFRWALNAFSPIVVPVTEKQRLKSKPTKELIHENLESDILKRPLIIFPEGGTTEANTLIKFQDGAFTDLQPVQPIALKYIYKHFDISWTNDISPLWLLYRMCCQFVNHLSVEYYDIVSPDMSESNIPQNDTMNTTNTTNTMDDITDTISSHQNHVIIEMNSREISESKMSDQIIMSTGEVIVDTESKASTSSGESKDNKKYVTCGKSSDSTNKHKQLVELFKNKVYKCYLNDPFFIQTSYSLSDSRITSKLKAVYKVPIEYVSELILNNGETGVTKICESTLLKRTELEKIIVKFYACNKVNATLDITQFDRFIGRTNLFDVNRLFDVIKTTKNYVTFSEVIAMFTQTSNTHEQIRDCFLKQEEHDLNVRDSILKQILQ